MKKIFTLLLSCFVLIGNAKSVNPAYKKLCDVNKCWAEQTDISQLHYPSNINYTDREWIAIHLQLVEQTLRTRNTTHLSDKQKINRVVALNHLNKYWKSGAFPFNEDFAYRLPIFIDKHDNFCAVGYLVKATGHEEVSRKVAANTNYAYVREMNYPELNSWAMEYGFTVDELAWIQPGYPPVRYASKVGKGTDGEVLELFVDGTGNNMYVGGLFKKVDDSIEANNIAYVTEASGVYSWHKMGKGVSGKVEAIAEFDNKVFAAGVFTKAGDSSVTNVAYWDGNVWHPAGCLWGEVKDLKMHNGELYACGSFDVCAALADINLAKWDTTYNIWQQIPGISGAINIMYSYNNDLVLGGSFNYTGKPYNVAKMNGQGNLVSFGNAIEHEVMDIEVFGDTLYAACKKVAANTDLLKKLVNNNWLNQNVFPSSSSQPIYSFNTLCVDKDTFMVSGNFNFFPMVGVYVSGNLDITSNVKLSYMDGRNSFIVDSTINDMVVFKGATIAGGIFKHGYNAQQVLNSMAQKVPDGAVSVQTLTNNEIGFNVYPNPANGIVTIENNMHATQLQVIDVNGKLVMSIIINDVSKQQVVLSEFASGTYFIELQNADGEIKMQRLVIK